ncbi:MAG: CTP synthase [Candidatus Abawacabacteria bacterium]|nr:CTP synthase [Candidatus Abawacabacteria bacterium]
MPQKFIITTGGVCSGLGKGISAASIGTILQGMGYSVFPMKFDPYLNLDPGTMNPFRHGEVFVTDDGAETDLDLGHYERFLDIALNRYSSVTTGQIYTRIFAQERRGEYLGRDVQIIPHVTDEIKRTIHEAAEQSQADVVTVEIGGTVGDIEAEPFLEALRQLREDVGADNICFVHVVLVPYLLASKELKTKPAQASVRDMREVGLRPDIIIARADYPLPQEILKKIAFFANVPEQAVIPAVTAESIYAVPLEFEKSDLGLTISQKLHLSYHEVNLRKWEALQVARKKAKKVKKIGLIAKYAGFDDAYFSVIEAIRAAAWAEGIKPEIIGVNAEDIEKHGTMVLEELDGIIVPGGYGKRGTEGKIMAAQYAREKKLPYLGLCLGMQMMVVEAARNLLKLNQATSEEFDPKAKDLVIHLMEAQKGVTDKGGTNRLGLYSCQLMKGTKTQQAYKKSKLEERHRHRYEYNNAYRDQLETVGLIVAGINPDLDLVEIVEIKDHPFMVGSQFHPEFLSRPTKPHPLFAGFMKAIAD